MSSDKEEEVLKLVITIPFDNEEGQLTPFGYFQAGGLAAKLQPIIGTYAVRTFSASTVSSTNSALWMAQIYHSNTEVDDAFGVDPETSAAAEAIAYLPFAEKRTDVLLVFVHEPTLFALAELFWTERFGSQVPEWQITEPGQAIVIDTVLGTLEVV